MPTYEYKREDGTIFEVRQSINDEPLAKCPDTGQKVTRVISGGGGVVYKGDGWYVTDYKDNGKSSSSDSHTNGSDKEKESAKSASDTSASSDTTSD